MQEQLIVVGLGNPGPKYAKGRHTIGAESLKHVASRAKIELDQRNRYSEFGKVDLGDHSLILARPRTFMNESGVAVSYLLNRFHCPPTSLLIVYDDLNLSVGRIRIRPRGSSGGHKGIESIIREIGTSEFPRLRIGIGRPNPRVDQVAYVLSPFAVGEGPIFQEVFSLVSEAVVCIQELGLEIAMNRFNSLVL